MLPTGDSSQDTLHDLSMHIGEAEVASLEFEGQAFVINAQRVQQRGLQHTHVALCVMSLSG